MAAREHARLVRAGAAPREPARSSSTCAPALRAGVVVFHDDTLARMTQRARLAPRQRRARGGARAHRPRQGATIPSLREVLAWARREGVAVNVEMKHDVPRRRSLARETVATVAASGADVLLSSFDPLLLALAAAYAPSAAARAAHADATSGAGRRTLQERVRPALAVALHLERTQARPDALARYRAPRPARRRMDGERPCRGARARAPRRRVDHHRPPRRDVASARRSVTTALTRSRRLRAHPRRRLLHERAFRQRRVPGEAVVRTVARRPSGRAPRGGSCAGSRRRRRDRSAAGAARGCRDPRAVRRSGRRRGRRGSAW